MARTSQQCLVDSEKVERAILILRGQLRGKLAHDHSARTLRKQIASLDVKILDLQQEYWQAVAAEQKQTPTITETYEERAVEHVD